MNTRFRVYKENCKEVKTNKKGLRKKKLTLKKKVQFKIENLKS